MTERRKRVPESEIKKLRFPDTPERLRLRQYNTYSSRLGYLRKVITEFQKGFKHYDKDDPPTFTNEEIHARFSELTQVIQIGNSQIKDTLSPAIQKTIEIVQEEREKLIPSVMAQVLVTRSEHEKVLDWAHNTEVDLALLLGSKGYPSPDPHVDAEVSYIWMNTLLHHTIEFGDNIVRSDRIHFFDPDISLSFSAGYSTNDFEVKRFNLALGMTPEIFSFVAGHLGFENFEELEGLDIEDKRDQTLRVALKLLYESSLKLDKRLPPYDKVYQDDF